VVALLGLPQRCRESGFRPRKPGSFHHVLINMLSLHYRRSTIHIPDNISGSSDIVENLIIYVSKITDFPCEMKKSSM
jgi:hypothetical protein